MITTKFLSAVKIEEELFRQELPKLLETAGEQCPGEYVLLKATYYPGMYAKDKQPIITYKKSSGESASENYYRLRNGHISVENKSYDSEDDFPVKHIKDLEYSDFVIELSLDELTAVAERLQKLGFK